MGTVCEQTHRPCVFLDRADEVAARPTVFLVDRDRAAREQTERALQGHKLPVEPFGDWSDFLSACSPQRTGCLVIDWDLLDVAGPAVLDRIGDSGATLPIIVFTAAASARHVVQAFQRGVFDFLQKPAVSDKLIESVRKAIAWDGSRRCLQWQLAEIERRRLHLDEHELELLALLMAGEVEKTLASRLDVSVARLVRLQSSLFEKMDANSIAELAGMEAVRDQLIELTNLPPKRIRFDQPHPDVSQMPTCPLCLKQMPIQESPPAASEAAARAEGDDEPPEETTIG